METPVSGRAGGLRVLFRNFLRGMETRERPRDGADDETSETSLEGWKQLQHGCRAAGLRHFRNFLRGMETLVGQGADLRRLVLPKLP